jgi:NitT/TauT family transport system substrate-binding protein
MFSRRPILLVLLLALAVCGISVHAQEATEAASGEMTDITLSMTFVPNIQFAPVYVALAKGYFAEEGINLELEYLNEPDIVELLAAGQRQFGVVSGEQVIMARAGERPVVFIYEWFQKFPVGIAVPADSGIESVADLAGRKVGIPGRFGASYSGLTAILAANGLTESDINLQEIGFNATEVLCVGGVDAAVVYINNEPLQIQERCTDVSVFPVSEFADLVSNGLVTSEDVIANNPELVARFVRAFDRGLRDTINNPPEAYLLSADYIENLPLDDEFRAGLESFAAERVEFLATNPSPEANAQARLIIRDSLAEQFEGNEGLLQMEILYNTIDLWDAEQLGYSDPVSWEVTQGILGSMSVLPQEIDTSLAFTNDFLPVNG